MPTKSKPLSRCRGKFASRNNGHKFQVIRETEAFVTFKCSCCQGVKKQPLAEYWIDKDCDRILLKMDKMLSLPSPWMSIIEKYER